MVSKLSQPASRIRNQAAMNRVVIMALAMVVAAILVASPARAAAPVKIDDARIAAAGIRKVPGKRLTLYTDLTGAEIDELPAVFEQAFPQWCRYFQVDPSEHADWSMIGFLMKDKSRFAAAGLIPHRLPPFEHGYAWDNMLWLYDQPSDYYRRHLLLHEGTHGFMNTILGGCGPMWYMEGIAEYLATHRWRDGRLTMAYMPANRDELPEWGRIRILQDAVAEHRALALEDVLAFVPKLGNETEPYAWCWAAATLLDRHPRYQQRFRELSKVVRQRDFNQRFRKLFASDWPELCEQWQLMVANLEYGYDVVRCAIDVTPGKPLAPCAANRRLAPGEGPQSRAVSVTVAADRGWQNSGLQLMAGVKYQLTATGRYQVATGSPRPLAGERQGARAIWWCEPGGVSIRYYQGRPLGILLAAVRPDTRRPGSDSTLLRPSVVGLEAELAPTETGTLFLKINDSPGELSDNAGELRVDIRPE